MFVDELIWKHHLGRFLTPELHHVQPWWFYFPVLAGLLFPWTPAVAALLQRSPNRDSRRVLLWLWLVFGFVFFSVARNKLPGYMLPLLPPACALMGIGLAESNGRRWVLPAACLLLCLLPVTAVVLPEALSFRPAGIAVCIPANVRRGGLCSRCRCLLVGRENRPPHFRRRPCRIGYACRCALHKDHGVSEAGCRGFRAALMEIYWRPARTGVHNRFTQGVALRVEFLFAATRARVRCCAEAAPPDANG